MPQGDRCAALLHPGQRPCISRSSSPPCCGTTVPLAQASVAIITSIPERVLHKGHHNLLFAARNIHYEQNDILYTSRKGPSLRTQQCKTLHCPKGKDSPLPEIARLSTSLPFPKYKDLPFPKHQDPPFPKSGYTDTVAQDVRDGRHNVCLTDACVMAIMGIMTAPLWAPQRP